MILKSAAIALSLLLALPAMAEMDIHSIEAKSRDKNDGPRLPFLVDLKKDKSIPIKPDEKLEPFRLYKRYDPDAKGWVFDVTDVEGKFQFSDEKGGVALGLNSSIPGEWAGGSSDEWYVFIGPSVTRAGWEKMPNPGQHGYFFLESTRQSFTKRKIFHSQKEKDK
jgi:hypothetical protein